MGGTSRRVESWEEQVGRWRAGRSKIGGRVAPWEEQVGGWPAQRSNSSFSKMSYILLQKYPCKKMADEKLGTFNRAGWWLAE